jgi:predicted ATP-grasp superfamily ATP-dependent carboligase
VNVKTPVVVLGAGYGGLGAARSLGRLGVAAWGVHSRGDAPGLASRYWRATAVWDMAASAEETLGFMRALAARVGRRAVLLPTTDAAALFIAAHAAALEEAFLFAAPPFELVRALVDKRRLQQLLAAAGLPAPRTAFPVDADAVRRFAREIGGPIVAKEADPRMPGVSWKAVVTNAEALLADAEAARILGLGNLMLQEYVAGGDDASWMFDGYFDAGSACRAAFVGRKLRQYPPGAGVASLAVCARNEEVEATVVAFLRGLGYRGMVDVDLRYDARDGRYKMLDVNPRLGAAFRLFVDRRGLDVARVAYLDATGQAIPPVEPVEGRRWMLEEDATALVRREGRIGALAWAASLRGVRELAWFALDDPRPLLARGLRGVRGRGASRGAHRPGLSASPARGARPS